MLIRDESANKKVQDDISVSWEVCSRERNLQRYPARLSYGNFTDKKERTQSALNNFREYSMLNAGPLASYIGFTEEEVKELL